MKETFPPMNGPYSLGDDEAFANLEIESRLTDYSIGGKIIYASFAWSVADEASKLALELAKKHGVGFFNSQTNEISCDEMILCKMRTESHEDKLVVWGKIESELFSLDSHDRGTTARSTAFVTMRFEQNKTDEEFMQCMPNYPKKDGLLKRVFGKSENIEKRIESYTIEVSTGDKIYGIQVGTKEEISQIFHEYYESHKLPDITGWINTEII